MICAAFYAPRPGGPEWNRWTVYRECLEVWRASCLRLGLKPIVIGDRVVPGFETACFTLPDNLMAATLSAQGQFLEQSGGRVAFVGADCLLLRDPAEMLADADMAVTVGDFDDCPLNTGLVVAHPRMAPVWQAALGAAGEEWADDQRALFRAITSSATDGWMIRMAPPDLWNYAPADGRQAPHDGLGMLHFRGARKAFMKEWWDRHG